MKTRMGDMNTEDAVNAGVPMMCYEPGTRPNSDTYTELFVGPRRRQLNGLPHKGNWKSGQFRWPSTAIISKPRHVINTKIVVTVREGGEVRELKYQYFWDDEEFLDGLDEGHPFREEGVLEVVSEDCSRVFAKHGQAVILDIEGTLPYAAQGSCTYYKPHIAEALKHEMDFDNANNQRILREMLRRDNNRESIVDNPFFQLGEAPETDANGRLTISSLS